MIIHNFGETDSLLNQYTAELRDVIIQRDSLRFRKNIERIGEILSYELSKTLDYQKKMVQTPLGNKKMSLPTSKLVLCSVLRAGLPLHQGLLNYFDKAENAFISAYRHHKEGKDEFEVIVNYMAAPSLDGKTLVLTDPMLATGRTLRNVYKALLRHGKPKEVHIISIIGSTSGISYIKDFFPENTTLWISAIDNVLDSRGYIIPGLGDAGDLSFGLKL